MNNILKKLFKMLAASIVIFCLALVGTLILNVIKHFCPILFWIIGISMLLFGGYFFWKQTLRTFLEVKICLKKG